MDLSDVRGNPKARRPRKRIGRGIAAGQGKTSGRGEKGQKHRYSIRPGFEGGQTPLYRRVPTLRGKGKAAHNRGMFGTEYAVVNVGLLAEKFEAGVEIDTDMLLAAGVIKKRLDGLKVLGQGELDKALHVKATAFSASAREKIEAAKGTAEVVEDEERLSALGQAMRIPDVRKRIIFLFAMLGVYVACAHVPLPGIDKAQLEQLFRGAGGLGDMLNAFAGGSLKRFSVLALGIMPYISASIILQLLTMAIPALEELQKEGEYGRKKINAWTKYLTVGVALIQALGMTAFFKQGNAFIGGGMLMVFVVTMMVAGTAFLMWIADMITERGIGQGISIIIFAGIITIMPQEIAATFKLWQAGEIGIANIAFLSVIMVATVYVIVKVQQSQRKIPVQYARRVRGHRMYGGQTSYLPLRVNQAGVMPIIFAISVSLFPGQIAQFIGSPAATAKISSVLHVSEEAVSGAMFSLVQFTTPGRNHFASFLYFLLVVLFTYFYTAVTFNPEQIAENLQKNGGAVPGIRPGSSTRDYLDRILYRITMAGALFLGIVAIMQYYIGAITGVTTFTLVGGTSLLIVVGVALDTMQQIEAQLLMRHYKGFLA